MKIELYERAAPKSIKKIEDLINNIDEVELNILVDSRGWVVDGNHRVSALYHLNRLQDANVRYINKEIEPYEYEENELLEMFKNATIVTEIEWNI